MRLLGELKLEFHDADTDTEILTSILADTSDTPDFLLFLWQAERHADILATILARKSVSVSASWLKATVKTSVWTTLDGSCDRLAINNALDEQLVRRGCCTVQPAAPVHVYSSLTSLRQRPDSHAYSCMYKRIETNS